jgi:hypothetical protein
MQSGCRRHPDFLWGSRIGDASLQNPDVKRIPSARTVRWTFFSLLILWTLLAGKDLSWDVINHHFYLPFAWLSGRISTDLFGAGPQSYQNPLGYFPAYGLIRAGLPAWVVGVALAALQAAVVWPLDRIARLVWPGHSEEEFWWRFLSLAFCCCAPVFLIMIGTTSIDPTTSLLVVWALALTLQPPTGRRWAGPIIAGVCLGVSCAVKLSNIVFAMAFCALWLFRRLTRQATNGGVLAFGAALAASFALTAGPWMWWLWHEFGNPVYPLFNNVFHSPYAPPQAITAVRFVPEGVVGAIVRLWEMAQLSSFVAFEAFLPDFRPLIAAVLLAAVAIMLLVRGRWRGLLARETWQSPTVQLVLTLVLTYVLWIRSSGNARYGLPLFVLLGIGIVRGAERLLPVSAAKIALLTALVLQCASYFAEGDYRFTGTAWDAGPYLEYRVPQRLREQPFLHVIIGVQTHASVALALDPRGALVNPIGQMPLPTTGPLGERYEALLHQWKGRTRLLFKAPNLDEAGGRERAEAGMRILLYRLGLDVDWNDCETIEIVMSRAEPQPEAVSTPGGVEPRTGRHLMSCAAIERPERDPIVDNQRLVAQRVFAILEAACPGVFSPTPFTEDRGPGFWQRTYMNTDARLNVSETDGVIYSHFRSINGVRFGSIDDILQHRVPIQCPRVTYQTPR